MSETDPAREAAAAAALQRIEAGMTIGLGSGRAVWRTMELARERWPEGPPVRAAFASERTAEFARQNRDLVDFDANRGIVKFKSDVTFAPGSAEVTPRAKDVIARFLVVAEAHKRVERLGQSFPLPVEVVRFGWPGTHRRVLELVPEAELRTVDGAPLVTDEGHHLLDCKLPAEGDLQPLAAAIKATVGVVEHGLFLGMADELLLGRPDGTVEELRKS